VVTAGNSDTGKAILGFCLDAGVPVIAIVRNEQAKQELEKLGAQHVLIQETSQFKKQFAELSAELKTTAVFDGVGGALLSEVLELAQPGTTVYAYGFLGGGTPVSFHTGILIKGITIKGFSNFKTETVLNHTQLAVALEEISKVLHLPHFKFNIGKKFGFNEIDQALSYVGSTAGKAVLTI
jgi:NADPH:quinone reductase-like Zn-dependent oxidoreductase